MFCIYCKKFTDNTGEEFMTAKNGRDMLVAECSICKHRKCKFCKKDNIQEGDGIVDDALKKAKSIKKGIKSLAKEGVKKTLSKRPGVINKLINNYGDYNISSVKICRTPILSLVDKALNFISLGKWEKNKDELHHDRIFHLFYEMELKKEGNTVYATLEKNQRVKSSVSNKPLKERKGSECVSVKSPNTDVKTFIENGENSQKNFYVYDPRTNNCQVFINTLNKANKISSKTVESFVVQPTRKLLDKFTGKIARAVTDVAGVADVALGGLGHTDPKVL